MTITDEMLIAYLGGKLPESDRLAVEAAIASDPSVAERLRRHREVGAMIQDAISAGGRQAARRRGEARPAPVVSLADARKSRDAPPAGPKTARPAGPAASGRKPLDPRWGALAVGALLGLAAGFFIPRPSTSLIDADLAARGVLAATLEGRLAAEQKADASVRILGTYRRDGGGWCRAFTSAAELSGLACRGRDGWVVVMSQLGASDPSPSRDAAIREMKLGAPVDAAVERRARSANWR